MAKRTTKSVPAAATHAKGKPSVVDRFIALPDAEKNAIVAEFDGGPIREADWRPLTSAQRQSWEATQARLQAGHVKPHRGRGRPVVGRGARSVQVSIEAALLADADDYARAHKLKRSQMIAAGLRLVMANGVTGDTAKA